MSLKVSVLIPTLGRKEELINTVRAFLGQTVKPYEIIVVDQNSPIDVEVQKFFKTILLVKHITGVPKGIVPNYNLCAKNASGDILLFVDDDVIPKSSLIEKHLKSYFEDPDGTLGGVAGRVNNAHGDLPPEKVKSSGHFNKFTGEVAAHFNGLKKVPVQFAQGANMSFRRSALEKPGGLILSFRGMPIFLKQTLD